MIELRETPTDSRGPYSNRGGPVNVSGTEALESSLQHGNVTSTTGNDAEVTKIILEEARLGRVFSDA